MIVVLADKFRINASATYDAASRSRTDFKISVYELPKWNELNSAYWTLISDHSFRNPTRDQRTIIVPAGQQRTNWLY